MAAMFIALGVAPARAQSPGCVLVQVVDAVTGEQVAKLVCGGHLAGVDAGGEHGADDDDDRLVYPLTRDGAGGPCVYLARVTLISGWDYDPPDVVLAAYLDAGVPWCPGLAPVGPRQWVEDWWRRQSLPRPQPVIRPGEMLVGLPAYLEANTPVVLAPLTAPTPFGPLDVRATSTLTVAWGDGATTGPYSNPGAPWPHGTITHTYGRGGAYDVVVTQQWTATWSLGGAGGTLGPAPTTGRVDDFPVRAVQAVGT